MKAGGSYAVVFGKKLLSFAAQALVLMLQLCCAFKRNFSRRAGSDRG